MSGTILIADDEPEIRNSLSTVLQEEGYISYTAADGEEALRMIMDQDVDVLISDIKMPVIDGMKLLEKTLQRSPQTLVVLITAYASVETAVQALRMGASDYLLKPLDFDEVILRLKHLLQRKALALENQYLREQIGREYNFYDIIGESDAMHGVFDLIRKVSGTTTNVLITGRSGTGKELVARAVHVNSNRADKRFIPVNCGAIPENLFESELFGYRKGAFSGAVSNHEGVFKEASGGTVFLDEIGEIPEHIQVKLLRTIQEKEIQPLGSSTAVKVDVRIVAATNRNLEEEVEKGNFRQDLFYRLNIIEIRLPELSERKEDIPLLARHFMNKYNREFHRRIKGIDNDAVKALMQYEWKGQVRELENVIERSVLLCEGDYIQKSDLPVGFQHSNTSTTGNSDLFGIENLDDSLAEFEKRHIIHILSMLNGNRSEAARRLGIDPSTLYRKMEKYQIK
ncbi:MAG TPA: sigma-54 dependent transcriptional regulator [Balneolales bacterium]|nr:sigma-54 dependent transcriptional regulator [Balneolales bacterium]